MEICSRIFIFAKVDVFVVLHPTWVQQANFVSVPAKMLHDNMIFLESLIFWHCLHVPDILSWLATKGWNQNFWHWQNSNVGSYSWLVQCHYDMMVQLTQLSFFHVMKNSAWMHSKGCENDELAESMTQTAPNIMSSPWVQITVIDVGFL